MISIASVISASGQVAHWDVALDTLFAASQQRRLVDRICWNGAISACEKAGQSKSSMSLLREMMHASFRPDTISFNAASSSFAAGGYWQDSLLCLEEIALSLGRPSVISHNSCISSSAAAAAWPQAACIFSTIRNSLLRPSMVSGSALLAACQEAAKWQMALDAQSWNSLKLFVAYIYSVYILVHM